MNKIIVSHKMQGKSNFYEWSVIDEGGCELFGGSVHGLEYIVSLLEGIGAKLPDGCDTSKNWVVTIDGV